MYTCRTIDRKMDRYIYTYREEEAVASVIAAVWMETAVVTVAVVAVVVVRIEVAVVPIVCLPNEEKEDMVCLQLINEEDEGDDDDDEDDEDDDDDKAVVVEVVVVPNRDCFGRVVASSPV
jgi:hypothetical protein